MMSELDITVLERKFEDARPPDFVRSWRVWLLAAVLVLDSGHALYRAAQRGEPWEAVSCAIMITFIAMAWNENQKLLRLHRQASELIDFYRGKAGR